MCFFSFTDPYWSHTYMGVSDAPCHVTVERVQGQGQHQSQLSVKVIQERSLHGGSINRGPHCRPQYAVIILSRGCFKSRSLISVNSRVQLIRNDRPQISVSGQAIRPKATTAWL